MTYSTLNTSQKQGGSHSTAPQEVTLGSSGLLRGTPECQGRWRLASYRHTLPTNLFWRGFAPKQSLKPLNHCRPTKPLVPGWTRELSTKQWHWKPTYSILRSLLWVTWYTCQNCLIWKHSAVHNNLGFLLGWHPFCTAIALTSGTTTKRLHLLQLLNRPFKTTEKLRACEMKGTIRGSQSVRMWQQMGRHTHNITTATVSLSSSLGCSWFLSLTFVKLISGHS